MTTQTMTAGAQRWNAIAQRLATIFGRQYDTRGLEDRVSRVTQEGGSATLMSEAVGNAFSKVGTYVEFGELSGALRSGPVLAWDKNGVPFLVSGRTFRGRYRLLSVDGTGEFSETTVRAGQLKRQYEGGQSFEDKPALDVWETKVEHSRIKRWFWDSMKPLFKVSKNLFLAALVGNMLAIAVSLFALQVWDRVIPANSTQTLAVLFIGVGIAILFELILRLQRTALIDDVGRLVDLSISSKVFNHVVGMKSDDRPRSLGSIAAQIREINQIREAVSSSMLSAAIDLPFTLVFVVVIYFIGGIMIIPIVIAIVVIILIGVLAQIPLSRLANAGLEEASLRNSLIVETIMKSDEIKLQQAEDTMQLRWERTIESGNTISNKQRRWRNLLSASTQSIQQLAYVLVVCMGAIFVIQGDATMGQVIACSILTNRAIAPMAQVSNVMGALQGSIVAKRSIDELMKRKTDLPSEEDLRRNLKAPDISIKNVRYNYPETENPVLVLPKLEIPFGQKVALIGRIGSGKSTMLRLLSGLVDPSMGTVLIDGTEMSSIHNEDLRYAVGFQSQSATLLHGTVRDNLLIARPSANDEELVKACEISGALSLIKDNPHGLDLLINEAGEGLSGGQRQSLMLARTILRDPPVALFDEPTASMDAESETNFIKSLEKWGKDKTVIIATHRTPPLSICDRILVVNEGRIAMDGPREEILAQLRSNGKKPAKAKEA